MSWRALSVLPLLALAGGCDAVTSSAAAVDGGTDGEAPLFVAVPLADGGEPDGGGPVNWFAVHGSGPDNVVMVGERGAVARWNGTRLAREPSGTSLDLRGVSVPSATEAYAVGAGGTLLHYHGGAWSALDSGTQALLNAVWSDGTRTFAVGVRGTALAYAPTLRAIATSSPDDLMAVASVHGDILAVGTLGTIAKFNGTSFSRTTYPGYTRTFTCAYAGNGGAFLGGLGGELLRLDNQMVEIPGLPPVFVRGVSAFGENAWVVGFDALVARVTADQVTLITAVPDVWYEGVHAASATDVWLVGNAGTILRTRPPMPDGGTDPGSRG